MGASQKAATTALVILFHRSHLLERCHGKRNLLPKSIMNYIISVGEFGPGGGTGTTQIHPPGFVCHDCNLQSCIVVSGTAG